MSAIRFFVAGTDTGVGKTRITAGLLAAGRAMGLSVAGMKPVASGAEIHAAGLVSADALLIAEASGQATPYKKINPYCLLDAISPHIAANRTNIKIDIRKIADIANQIAARHELLLIEGAGGWYTPISDRESMANVAKAIAAPVVLVIAMRLGCLNHAQLTREAIEHSGCSLAGWIATRIDPHFAVADENIATLERLMRSPPLAVLPHTVDPARDLGHLRVALSHLLPPGVRESHHA